MNTIKEFEESGYDGTDVDLETALFEYGLIWLERDMEFHFVYGIEVDDAGDYTRFTWGDISKDVDIKKEYNWIDAADWVSVVSSTGLDEVEFFAQSIPSIIYDLIAYFGIENIFGTDYSGGFEVEK